MITLMNTTSMRFVFQKTPPYQGNYSSAHSPPPRAKKQHYAFKLFDTTPKPLSSASMTVSNSSCYNMSTASAVSSSTSNTTTTSNNNTVDTPLKLLPFSPSQFFNSPCPGSVFRPGGGGTSSNGKSLLATSTPVKRAGTAQVMID